jgi:hypothetical protein
MRGDKMQSITTKYLGPTNYRGSRIKAECTVGSVTVSYAYELTSDENHRAAAEKLIEKLGWTSPHYGKWVQGTLKDERGVFVCAEF